MKKIILVDGSSLMFRSYYATAYMGNLMQNKQGIYTNAVFGFCNMIEKIQEQDMTHLFVAFDMGAKTLRHQSFEEYKAQRKAIPRELLMQIPYIKRFLETKNIMHSEMSDYEADDLIATLATMASEQGFDDIKIITGDKDLLQLVDDNINVWITKKGVTEFDVFSKDNFFEKTDIYPSQVPDYKGLVGDASDNLPGIKGIGKITAIKLLNEYASLEGIYQHRDSIKGKTKELIETGFAMGAQCKQLATLEKDVALEFSVEDTRRVDFDVDALVQFYKELEFTALMNRLDIKQTENLDFSYDIIDDVDYDFSHLSHAYVIAEIFGDNYYLGEFLGLGLMHHKDYLFLTPKTVFENKSFHHFLADNTKPKFSFAIKKLYVVLKKQNISINHICFDLLLATYVLNPNDSNEDFKKVADLFQATSINYDETVYGYKSKAAIPSMDVIANHAISKCIVLKSIKDKVLEKIKQSNQAPLLALEMDLSAVLGDMECRGLKIDVEKLKVIQEDMTEKQGKVAERIYQLANTRFNINSVKQLGDVLFGQLKLPTGKKNKTGYSTNSDVLEKLALKYPIAQAILDYRALTKIITTYVNGLLELVDEANEVHPLYKQTLTVTGRLSSIEPNIQNMPIRTELGQVIRDAFISRYPLGKILSIDYSQIELRILAHLSNDQTMIRMFKEKIDFHNQTASQMYEVPLEEVTKEMRRAAKAINFGIIYGMSVWGLSEAISISQEDANRYIQKYFATFKEVKIYLDKTIEDARQLGYAKTMFNRIRYLPEINSQNKALAGFGERTAMNSPIQGSAADIIKKAMITVNQGLNGMQSQMIAQVHDELVFDVVDGEMDACIDIASKAMESVVKLAVPLLVDVSYGDSWLKQ